MLVRRSVAISATLLGLSSVFGMSPEAAGQANRMQLLTDGTSLGNFDRVGDANWRIAERTVVADTGSGFLVTKQPYGDFRLRAEVWVDEDANSGIFIRCSDPKKIGGETCYEVNIFDTRPDPSYGTGAIVNVAKVNPMPRAALHWNVLEIEAKGPQLNISFNGERTVSVRDSKHPRGYIGLQYGAGVVRWHKVEIQPLTAEDIAQEASPLYANCQSGFAVLYPGQPTARDTTYTLAGATWPAREFFVQKGGNRYSVLVADYAKGPKADEKIVEQAAAELARRGQVRFQNNGDYDPGMPGHQLDIFEPNGKQLRASVYMAQHRLTITQAEAAPNDLDALQFEQSIVLIDHAGTDVDRVNAMNDEPRTFDCR